MSKTAVVFMKHPNGDEYALFPDTLFDDKGNKMSYSLVGQHSACSDDYERESLQMSEPEYLPLQKELEAIGYDLEIINYK